MHVEIGWNNFKWLNTFHPTYMCIIHILNAQHSCAENMNSWKKWFSHDFHYQDVRWEVCDVKRTTL